MQEMSHNPSVTFKSSTKEEIMELSGLDKVPSTIRSITFFLDGTPSGIGGIQYLPGNFVAFCNIKDGIMVSKATIVRCGLEVMKMIRSTGFPVIAVADPKKNTAPRFLKAMGFSYSHSYEEGDVYKCRD